MEEPVNSSRKRKALQKKGSNFKKKKKHNMQNQSLGIEKKVKKMDPKLKKMLRKKARDYNSDDDNEEQRVNPFVDDDDDYVDSDNEGGEGEVLPEITKFGEGIRAFRIAFKSIMSKSVADDSLGPVLSGHSKLIAKKLDEELAERKVKGEAKKEKKLVAEQGHVKPANFLDSHEKFLISVATKGVVKLFNAVNKAQNAQKGLNPSRTKDDKVIKKRRKEAFFSELGKTPAGNTSTGNSRSSDTVDREGPSWAPLRDNYMLTNSKLKDWDKMPDTAVTDDTGNISEESSSDDD